MKNQQQSYIGADLGGTKLLLAEMTREGKVLRSRRFPSGQMDQRQAFELIQNSLDEFLAERTPGYSPVAIGVGLVGRVDNRAGIWYEISPSMCDPIPVAERFQKRYGIPCFLDNDVRSATKAEMRFGYGRASKNLIYINIGTGIAAGFITDGRLVCGSHFNAGEVGYITSGVALQVPCPCGRPDCIEMVASGVGLNASAHLLHQKYPQSKLVFPEDGSRVAAEDIFKLRETDALCAELVENAAAGIANLIMNLVRFNDPDAVVLGGGLISDGILWKMIQERLNPETMRFVTNGVVLTKLDPRYVGILGACCNAINGLEEAK